jgi:hypothetical protein
MALDRQRSLRGGYIIHLNIALNLSNSKSIYFIGTVSGMGFAVAQLFEALLYKPVGRGFDSRLRHWNFSLTYSFRPPTEMSTRNIS